MPEIFGKQVSKGTIWIGAGAAGLLGIAVYRYRKQQAADAATAAANAAAQAPGTGAGSSDQIDPATGFPYGSAEDAAALTAQSGYNSPIGGTGYYGYGMPNVYPSTQPASFTSNAQWSQAAEQYMVNQGGDANAIGNALGKYITGQPLDESGQSLVNQAIAFEGYPPVGGPNGFPPSMNTANPGSTGSTPGSGTEPAPNPSPTPSPTPKPDNDKVAVPNLIGLNLGNAIQTVNHLGLHHNGTVYNGSLNQVVTKQYPKAGTKVSEGFYVNITAVKK